MKQRKVSEVSSGDSKINNIYLRLIRFRSQKTLITILDRDGAFCNAQCVNKQLKTSGMPTDITVFERKESSIAKS
jgi:hypothetical protein